MAHPLHFSELDFDQAPFLVIWETTQACGLACRHCRAEAQERRDAGELSTEEGKRLLDEIHAMGTPVCVLSGGDPLRRPDLEELVAHGSALGLRMATIPAATPELTRARLTALRDAGLAQVAFSLDGSTEALHDGFRQVPGTFARTLEAAAWARDLGLPLQINTTFAKFNFDDRFALAELVASLGVVFWEVFSVVPVGRGSVLEPLSAGEHELLFELLYSVSAAHSFVVKITEAPHFRRYVLARRAAAGGGHPGAAPSGGHPGVAPSGGHPGAAPPGAAMAPSGSAVPAQLARELSVRQSFGARARGINAGKGFCFVSHRGEVFPSGFIPRAVGQVRERPLGEIYRTATLLRELRRPELLAGRCGACEYADVCGGSRARAAAATGGDLFAEDPACSYQPAALRG